MDCKAEYLETLGFEILGEGGGVLSFSGDYDYEIEFDDFEVGDTVQLIVSRANTISCCGDIVDTDYMMCPACSEHI